MAHNRTLCLVGGATAGDAWLFPFKPVFRANVDSNVEDVSSRAAAAAEQAPGYQCPLTTVLTLYIYIYVYRLIYIYI